MSDHNHHHCCSHSADENVFELGIEYSLYTKILIDSVQCLNEKVDGSGKTIFKPWDKRLEGDECVESDVDEELLFNIPFTGNVKLKGIIVIGGEEDSHPSKMKLFKNRPNFTFDDTSIPADEEFELHPDRNGTVEYTLKIVKFSSVHHLSIYFPKNFGAETTKVYYIGLKGEFTSPFRQEIALCSYESAANPADHCQIKTFTNVPQAIQ